MRRADSQHPTRGGHPRWLAAGAVLAVVLAGCSSTSAPTPTPTPTQTIAKADTIATLAHDLATADHHHRTAPYRHDLKSLARICHTTAPKRLQTTVSTGYRALTAHHLAGASYLSVLGSLTARVGPKGPPASCGRAVAAYVAEVSGPAATLRGYAGYAATTEAWDHAHRADPARAGEYLPRLPDGHDSFELVGADRVTTLVRYFDPPLSAAVALSVIRRTLLPPEPLRSVYTLQTANCSEQIFLSHTLGTLLSSPSLGVMVELTSGHGVSSHFRAALINRARFTIGGRIGGQPCV